MEIYRLEAGAKVHPHGSPALQVIHDEFPGVGVIRQERQDASRFDLDVSTWKDQALDLYAFDRAMETRAAEHPFYIDVAVESGAIEGSIALEILTRCQRLFDRRNEASRAPLFDRVLAVHRALHDLDKPLVVADLAHAVDTWQWMLRLAPEAPLAAQIAALFHDVERLASEPDARIEQHASDYQRFKDAHAKRGSTIAVDALIRAGVPTPILLRAATLVRGHERTSDDPDIALLNDADGLSFFSLNSAGFLDYFGDAHTKRKVAYTLRRLRPQTRSRLASIRYCPGVARMLSEVVAEARLSAT